MVALTWSCSQEPVVAKNRNPPTHFYRYKMAGEKKFTDSFRLLL